MLSWYPAKLACLSSPFFKRFDLSWWCISHCVVVVLRNLLFNTVLSIMILSQTSFLLLLILYFFAALPTWASSSGTNRASLRCHGAALYRHSGKLGKKHDSIAPSSSFNDCSRRRRNAQLDSDFDHIHNSITEAIAKTQQRPVERMEVR